MLRAQGAAVKVGVLHPVSGALSYSGQQGRIGAQMAIEEINAAGGIRSLGGAKIEAVLGDAQSTPDGGNAEVARLVEQIHQRALQTYGPKSGEMSVVKLFEEASGTQWRLPSQ